MLEGGYVLYVGLVAFSRYSPGVIAALATMGIGTVGLGIRSLLIYRRKNTAPTDSGRGPRLRSDHAAERQGR